MRTPSIKALLQVFPDKHHAQVAKAILECYNGIVLEEILNLHGLRPLPRELVASIRDRNRFFDLDLAIMQALNALGGFAGVESLQIRRTIMEPNSEHAQDYLRYLNAGDPYTQTIVLLPTGTFLVRDWGFYAERLPDPDARLTRPVVLQWRASQPARSAT